MSGYARLFPIFGKGNYLRGLKLEGASSGCQPAGWLRGPGLPGTRGEEGPTAGLRTPAPGNVSLAPESLSRSCQWTPPSSRCQMWVTGPLLTRVWQEGPYCLSGPGAQPLGGMWTGNNMGVVKRREEWMSVDRQVSAVAMALGPSFIWRVSWAGHKVIGKSHGLK